jgi:hypothetical protein
LVAPRVGRDRQQMAQGSTLCCHFAHREAAT